MRVSQDWNVDRTPFPYKRSNLNTSKMHHALDSNLRFDHSFRKQFAVSGGKKKVGNIHLTSTKSQPSSFIITGIGTGYGVTLVG